MPLVSLLLYNCNLYKKKRVLYFLISTFKSKKDSEKFAEHPLLNFIFGLCKLHNSLHKLLFFPKNKNKNCLKQTASYMFKTTILNYYNIYHSY